MRKIALSLVVLGASGAYVWSQSGNAGFEDPLGPLPPLGPQSALGSESTLGPEQRNSAIQTGSIATRKPVLVSAPATASFQLQPAVESGWSDNAETSADDDGFAARTLPDTPSSPELSGTDCHGGALRTAAGVKPSCCGPRCACRERRSTADRRDVGQASGRADEHRRGPPAASPSCLSGASRQHADCARSSRERYRDARCHELHAERPVRRRHL